MGDPRLAIVTGATGAIGGAIAAGIARHLDHDLLLLVRDDARGRRAAEQIRRATGNPRVSCETVDLSLNKSILDFAERFKGKVKVLVNCAAVAPRSRQVTVEGHEVTFATNVLGYLWLTRALSPHMTRAAPARVVNLASYWAGDLDVADLEFQRRKFDNSSAYRQSKQANRMLTVALAEQLSPHHITVNACHPGDVNSTLSNSLGFGGSETAEAGAQTPLWLALSDEVSQISGKYFVGCVQAKCAFANDRLAIQRLLAACGG